VWANNVTIGRNWPIFGGEGTFSATPPAWSHAQYVRLARSLRAGRPVEQPGIVAARYGAR
jgi:glucoamylase